MDSGQNGANPEMQRYLAMSSYNGNALYGKKWAVCGDSFTAGVTGTLIREGRFKGQNIAYPYLIAEEAKQAVKIKQAADYPTNTHPNDKTHEFESWFIEDFLRRI